MPGIDENGTTAALLAGDPWWLMLIKAIGVFVFLLLMTLFAIWFERKVVGRMQHRPGPNWNGPFGLLQSIADAVKLMFKEGTIPAKADKVVFVLAPLMICIPAFLTFSVIPMGGQVSMFGHQTAIQLTDLPNGALAVLAFAAIGVYGIALGGWASGSTYPLLGGLRSAAQLISYEIAMGLSFVAVFLYAGTLSTSGIVTAQTSGWYFWLLPVSFLVYVVSMVGETNRAPFDMAEAEGELVGGFNTEYTSMRFGLFFLAEYINVVNVSAILTTLFLGGWRAPWPLSLWEGANAGWWTFVWFLIKVLLVMFFFVWIRGTLPRIRYDQFMALGWKVLVPVSLAWIMLVGTAQGAQQRHHAEHAGSAALDGRRAGRVCWSRRSSGPSERTTDDDLDDDDEPGFLDAPPGPRGDGTVEIIRPATTAYPIPPMDLKVPASPPRSAVPVPHRAAAGAGDDQIPGRES